MPTDSGLEQIIKDAQQQLGIPAARPDALPFGLSPVQFALIVPLWVAGLYLFALWSLSAVSGWGTLAKQFRAGRRPLGTAYAGCSLRGRLNSRYTNSIHVVLSEYGVYLAPVAFFRPFHPPLIIPWHLVTVDAARTVYGPRTILFIRATDVALDLDLPPDASERAAPFTQPTHIDAPESRGSSPTETP